MLDKLDSTLNLKLVVPLWDFTNDFKWNFNIENTEYELNGEPGKALGQLFNLAVATTV